MPSWLLAEIGYRITDTEVIKFIDICHALLKIVYFINNKYNRLMGPPQHVRHLGICIDQSLLARLP